MWPRALLATVVFSAELFMLDRMRSAAEGEVVAARNFFGAVRVHRLASNNIEIVQLTHGQINHGFQYLDDKLYRQPAGYCNPESGAGLALTRHPRRDPTGNGKNAQPIRVGVAGSVSVPWPPTAARAMSFGFYEINPLVLDYAAGPKPYFTYIKDTPAQVDTVLGDARLALEREARRALHLKVGSVARCSPAALGKHYPKAQIDFVRPPAGDATQGPTYMQLTLTDVLITGYSFASSSSDLPLESVSMNFSKFTIGYTDRANTGSFKVTYDVHTTDTSFSIGVPQNKPPTLSPVSTKLGVEPSTAVVQCHDR